MRTADAILTVIHERGKRGLPLERVYRLLFNRDLYLRAYARLYPNAGALTRGSTPETVDGMSLAKIDRIIEALRFERYRWTPVRRVYIPKPRGKGMRPLGIPAWSDKLLQDVLRSILEAYYDPQFSDHAHGFRPARGCHTALATIQTQWTGTRWFIEGDIARCFDAIDHDILIGIMRERIHDERFLRLLGGLLDAGYLEDWKLHRTVSGTPQGGVVSPILSNIYLDRFDQWVTTTLIPAFTRGAKHKRHPEYMRLCHQLSAKRQRGDREGVRAMVLRRRTLPSIDPLDPDYRRLRYVRYADDFVLGFTGPKAEAERIKGQIKEWLRDHLKLDLSEEKTLITHATTEAARFLGYDLMNRQANDWLDSRKRRGINGVISLRVPASVVEAKCARYHKGGIVMHRTELIHHSDYTIVSTYQAEYRGIVQYYRLAHNIAWLNRLQWVMQGSLLKTLAAKHKSTMRAMRERYATTTTDPTTGQTLACLEVRVERDGKPPLVARFGGISLVRQPEAILNDTPPRVWGRGTELLTRFLAEECELCGSRDHIEVHHIRKLADLKRHGRRDRPAWVRVMASRQRKTLVVCRACHQAIHQGKPTRQRPLE
jgi:group II intron reverse transcriptase/maturase